MYYLDGLRFERAVLPCYITFICFGKYWVLLWYCLRPLKFRTPVTQFSDISCKGTLNQFN
jgi:hypothetical protein